MTQPAPRWTPPYTSHDTPHRQRVMGCVHAMRSWHGSAARRSWDGYRATEWEFPTLRPSTEEDSPMIEWMGEALRTPEWYAAHAATLIRPLHEETPPVTAALYQLHEK